MQTYSKINKVHFHEVYSSSLVLMPFEMEKTINTETSVMRMRRPTKLLPQALELIQVSLVLRLVLHLLLHTLEDPDSRCIVVNATGGAHSSLDDGGRRNKVVGEAVVEAPLDLEQILGLLEESDVALREGLESFLMRGG